MSELDELEGWITTDVAAALAGCSTSLIRRLASRGRIAAVWIGRAWLVRRADVVAYKAQMEALGARKHSPWRDDLAAQGRGRKRSGK